MKLTNIVLVFLYAVTGKAIQEAAGAAIEPMEIDNDQFFEAATGIMDAHCGPFGFFNCFDGSCSCYLVLPSKVNYNQASKYCHHFQGQLTKLSSQEENYFVASILERSNIRDAWIGLSRDDSSKEFGWADKSAVSYSALKENGQNGNCVQLSSNNNWVSYDCTKSNAPFVCEVSYKPTEQEPTCRPGWAKFGNHCYQLHKERRSWDDAQKRCSCMGSNLVSIHSFEESEFTLEMLTMSDLPITWIGFRLNLKTKDFDWVDGTMNNFTHWRHDQPDYYQNNEECGETRTQYRRWNDLPCDTHLHYMCKTDLNRKMA